MVGLVEALNRYNPASGVPFERFAYSRMRGAIYDFLRDQSPLCRRQLNRGVRYEWERSLSEPVSPNADGDLCLADTIADLSSSTALEVLLQEEKLKRLATALGDLRDRQRTGLSMRYDERLPIRSVALQLGLCRASISMIQAGAIRKLRDTLAADSTYS
jgi:RNA polymerase sigma factor for flagellar operon FliA